MKKKVTLICESCNLRNYSINRSNNINKRIILKKFCKNCNKHTIHKETK